MATTCGRATPQPPCCSALGLLGTEAREPDLGRRATESTSPTPLSKDTFLAHTVFLAPALGILTQLEREREGASLSLSFGGGADQPQPSRLQAPRLPRQEGRISSPGPPSSSCLLREALAQAASRPHPQHLSLPSHPSPNPPAAPSAISSPLLITAHHRVNNLVQPGPTSASGLPGSSLRNAAARRLPGAARALRAGWGAAFGSRAGTARRRAG